MTTYELPADTDAIDTAARQAVLRFYDPSNDYGDDFDFARADHDLARAAARVGAAAELRRLAAEDEAQIECLRFTPSRFSNGPSGQTVQVVIDGFRASRARLLARADELDGGQR